ncbi:MAG TPA: polysaccharide deacetylase family protein [Gaiellaceae bacterium]|nr:polysaccharide deacetylase family protein [Gaiellaceae bacterium]
MIPLQVERRARWVLDAMGARDLAIGDGVAYRPDAWGAIERGERPEGDLVAEAFYDLARVEELAAARDEHGRFSAGSSGLDPLDPPLERLRSDLGIASPTWDGATFAVALTHDVDSVRRWTGAGVVGALARLRNDLAARRSGAALRETRGLALAPLHKLRGTDPNWRFSEIVRTTRRHGASGCTFFVLGGHADPHDGNAPELYERLRPRLVGELQELDAEVGLHGSYRTARDGHRLAGEKRALEACGATVTGHRYHYLRVDPHHNLEQLAEAGLRYDSTLGFADALGFRGGLARPFRPWDFALDEPLDLVELPLAAMDVTLAEARYLGLSPRAAWPLLERLLDVAMTYGAGFALLWHPDRFDRVTSGGWDALYWRFLDEVKERGGRCMSAAELVEVWLQTQ